MPVANLEVTSDHVVPVATLGGTATVLNNGPGTVFYADSQQVSSTVNQGSLTSGQSVSFTSPQWIIASGLAAVQITTGSVSSVDVVLGSDGKVGGPGGTALTSSIVTAGSAISPPSGLTGSNAYDPLRSIYNGKALALRRLRAALTKAESGQDLGRIWCLGDSLTAGTGSNPAVGAYPVFLRKALAALGYTTAGTGLALVNPAFGPPFQDSRWTSSGSVTTSFLNFQSYTGAANASFTFASDVAGNTVNIYYWDQNGPFTYQIDGAAAVTVTPGSTFNLRRVQVTGLSNATHTVVIASTVAGVGAVIAGVEVTNSFGLEVSNLGLPGITTAQWLQGFPGGAQPYPQSFVAAMSSQLSIVPDFVFLCLGVNDANQNVTTATYTANMTTIINDLTGRGSGVAIVVPMTPALPTDGQSLSMSAATWLSYRQAMYTLGDNLGVPVVDLSDRGGPWATANTNRLMYNQIGSVNGTVSGTAVTNWLNQAPPQIGSPLLGQGLNGKFVTGGISGVPGSWNFTASAAGTTGTGQIQVGPNSDGFHPNAAGYSFMANALAALAGS